MLRRKEVGDWSISFKDYFPYWGAALFAFIWLYISGTDSAIPKSYDLWITEDIGISINRWFDVIFIFIQLVFFKRVCRWLIARDIYRFDNDDLYWIFGIAAVLGAAAGLAVMTDSCGEVFTGCQTFFLPTISKVLLPIFIVSLFVCGICRCLATGVAVYLFMLVSFGTAVGLLMGFAMSMLYNIAAVPILVMMHYMPQIQEAIKRIAYELVLQKNQIMNRVRLGPSSKKDEDRED